ncbi:CPBP family intramembrane glutamic endopeptidase [Staphylococcus epidermidis]|uniref:CPBP family intramembrane glutamic endopeptidase n=1 Tax=Staphylococcus epidermidis TaxID=1282 RepID=UPI001D0D8087|nr:CPBP family intramembrane glutamic endopeptidase [Staphylococcus epidermidis]MCO6345201.1 CPBP family intramembrane metalloprotease [Staphylococcus epidermidis]
MIFVKYVKKQNLITPKYMKTENGNWLWKLTLILLGLLVNLCLDSNFNSNTENQKLVEKQNQHLDMYTQLVHVSLNAGIIEEICFRGLIFIFIFTILNFFFNEKKYNHDWLSLGLFVLISSLASGFAHVLRGEDWSHIWVYALTSFTFSLLFIFSKDIKTCMIYHVLTNAFTTFNHNHLSFIEPMIYIILLIISVRYLVRNYRKWL